MKKLLILLSVVLLLSLGSVAVAYAEEQPAETTTETTESKLAEYEQKIGEYVALIQDYENENYFSNNILPVLIGLGSALLGGLAAVFPAIKKSVAFKQLQGAYAMLNKNYDELKKLLAETDITKIKEALSAGITDELKEFKEVVDGKIKDGYGAVLDFKTEFKTDLELLENKLTALTSAAQVVWHGSPEAVEALSKSATYETALQATAREKKLEAYIREQKGEEADAIIAEVLGA